MKIKRYLKYPLIVFFLLLLSSPVFSKVIYVDADNSGGNNDGTSWNNSFTILQFAIGEAEYGDTIWVAEGIYKPTNSSFRTIYFSLNNGVKWYGGFQGNETELSQRDIEINETILSGDIGVQGDSTDNSYHVVYTLGTDSTTIIDGFSIIHGQANHNNSTYFGHFNYGGGISVDVDLTNTTAMPQILNCTFQHNSAKIGGGAISIFTTLSSHINPLIDNCKFYDNSSILQWGGAIYREGGEFTGEDYIISNCVFERNFAKTFGGALYIKNIPNRQVFLNCDFIENHAIVNGGGAYIEQKLYLTPLQETTFSGCNFIQNKATNSDISTKSGGGIFFYNTSQVLSSETEFAFKIQDSNFIGNHVNTGIGGVYLTFSHLYNWIIENVKFIDNQSYYGVGAMETTKYFNDCSQMDCEWEGYIENCTFRNNKSLDDESGSIEFLFYGSPENEDYKIYINNTIFEENLRLMRIFNYSSLDTLVTFFNNCTFYKNEGEVILKEGNTPTNIANSIFWEDHTIDQIFVGNAEGYNIHHSLLKSPDCFINGIDYCGDGMLYNLYPEFRDTMNNDFSLRSCSPAINQGENISIDTLGIFFDIEGNPRILDDAVDLGAYETQAFEVLVPQAQNVQCHGGADGAITWVQHGTPPFTFEWDNGVTIGTEFTGLSAGNYSIAVMDADNCLDTFSMTVNQPLLLEITDTITAATGAMNADGMIEVIPTGGVPNYQYLWSNGDSTALVENILPGTYTVTVVDANGCVEILEMEVGFMTAVNNLDKKYSVRLIPNLMEQGATTYLHFDLEENTYFELELFNEIGQLLFSKKIEMGAGKSIYELPILESRGLFFVKIKDNSGKHQVLKFLVT
ncbi:MAG: choice-of-anchor Q domain-containing protein [Saprospiraceae bacterium]